MKVDVLIAGGGPAGLSAALVLGRCLRQVLICDEDRQRNRASHAIHALLGREGLRSFRDGREDELAARAKVASNPDQFSSAAQVSRVIQTDRRP